MERHNGPRSGESRRTSAGGETYSERAAEAIHDHVDEIEERLEAGEERLREAAANAKEEIEDARDRAGEDLKVLAELARGYVRDHPLTSAAVAFAAGVVFVSVLRR
jgi:ElaB/YqjD/DUF883 family membrane-anchored ribosome-binding protein